MTVGTSLPSVEQQISRLIALGVPELAGLSVEAFVEFGRLLPQNHPNSLVVVSPNLVNVATLAPLLRLNNKPGFVVVDLTDLEEFVEIPGQERPDAPLYLVEGLERGDEMANWSPSEALPAILDRTRIPLTIGEGVSWLLQRPDVLESNHCFMTIASRKRKKSDGSVLDSRTPAIWISGGTGRDGKEAKGAPKVGWCWANNRHTWLGFASADRVVPVEEFQP